MRRNGAGKGAVEDATVARGAATAAGERLLALRRTGAVSGRSLAQRGDAAAQSAISEVLQTFRPFDAVLSEEAPDDAGRLDVERVWIVDPLDGTREFAESGRVDWAVHVALWERGSVATGVVACPAQCITFGTDFPPSLPPRRSSAPRIAVSRTRPPSAALHLTESLGAVLVPMGSAGAKVCAVLLGDVDAYVHAGGQFEWDSAAPVAVARAAGLHASRLDGSPLRYNQRDPYLPDLVVCRTEIASRLLDVLAVTSTTAGAAS